MSTAIYLRVSTEAQAEQGYSLAAQREACLRLAPDAKVYTDDGYSGEFLDRPALSRLREDVRAGLIRRVVVYDPDRLSRNLTNQLLLADEIERAGAQLVFVTHSYDASPEGRLFFSIRGAISAFEKAKIRERTMAGKRTKALSGKVIFNDNPIGYDWDSEKSMYIINEGEAEIIRKIFDLCVVDHMGVRSIALHLRQQNVRNKKGKHFTPSNVHRILTNKMYCGVKQSFQVYNKKIGQSKVELVRRPESEWIPISVPAIVTEETWEKAQAVLQSNKLFAKRNAKRQYLLKGLLRCGICGRSMIGVCRTIKGKEYQYYVCSTTMQAWYNKTETCPNRHVPAQVIEEAVWQAVLNISQGTRTLESYSVITETQDNSEQIKRLNLYLADLHAKRADIMRWFRDGLLASEDAEKELQFIQREITSSAAVLRELEAATSARQNSELDFKDARLAKTFQEKRNFLEKLNRSIVVTKFEDTLEWRFT